MFFFIGPVYFCILSLLLYAFQFLFWIGWVLYVYKVETTYFRFVSHSGLLQKKAISIGFCSCWYLSLSLSQVKSRCKLQKGRSMEGLRSCTMQNYIFHLFFARKILHTTKVRFCLKLFNRFFFSFLFTFESFFFS